MAPERQRATTSSGRLVKTGVQLTPDQVDALDAIAAETNESRSGVIRRAIVEWLRGLRRGRVA